MSLTTSPGLMLGNAGFSAGAGGVRLSQGGGSILQPIVLTSPLGVVFVNAEGNVLTRGTRVVEPIDYFTNFQILDENGDPTPLYILNDEFEYVQLQVRI